MHVTFKPETPISGAATFDDFLTLDVRAGTVVSAEPLANARKSAFVLEIEFGAGVGKRKSSAQITEHYGCQDLIGSKVLAVVNFPPRQVGKIMSEVLVLGCADEKGATVLVRPDMSVPDGARLT